MKSFFGLGKYLGFGEFHKLAHETGSNDGSDWSDSEEGLCSAYGKYIHYPDEAEFNNNLSYLHKAEDGGRTPTPKWMWVFLSALVVAEGLGFSFLLGTWMASEGSENQQSLMMWAIVLVLSGILMWVTHSAGHQLYRTNLIVHHKKNRGTQRGSGGDIVPKQLSQSQSVDDGQPTSLQCLNRVGDRGNYAWMIIAVIFILAIAAGSTWMRFHHMKVMLNSETTGQTVTVNPTAIFSSSSPGELSDPQKDADKKAKDDQNHEQTLEGAGAFIMIAFIFVVTQIVGIGTGYKYGFAGEYSSKAYEGTRGFTSYRQVREYYKPRIQIADARLKALQIELAKQQSNHHLNLKQRFADYLVKRSVDTDAFHNAMSATVTSGVVSQTVMGYSEGQSTTKHPQIEAPNEQIHSPQVTVAPESSSQPKSKFCSDCGSAIAVNAKFCGGCGFRFA